ncbi:hypothetical protein Adeg_0320 [Ammonifex degensii KC4]|uniref:Uncharacterized protein n=1 Tax=Ammonifex degensii (strain DSM 10501 / KC4) TaxID=429009 RepID=C9RB56_AMMDK|nr:hypothetical protein [Ammonifex degensii]ACX51483.1 hypothetical protein Adeg_0320 [Ammonifex degensii KC4]
MAVATGRVAKIWVEVPETSSLEEVKQEFARFFGHRWEDVVVGKEREKLFPFWQAYIGVTDLRPCPQKTVTQVRQEAGEIPVYEILLG